MPLWDGVTHGESGMLRGFCRAWGTKGGPENKLIGTKNSGLKKAAAFIWRLELNGVIQKLRASEIVKFELRAFLTPVLKFATYDACVRMPHVVH